MDKDKVISSPKTPWLIWNRSTWVSETTLSARSSSSQILQPGGESGLSRPAERRHGRGELSWCVCSKAAISEGVDLDMWTRHFVILHAHSLLLAENCIAFFFLSHWSRILTTVSFQKTYHFLPGIFSFFVRKYHIWDTKHHCQQNKSAVAMLPCVVCRFETLSKNIGRCICKTSMTNLKSFLVNRIVVTQVTLIWLFILKELKMCMHNRKYCTWISFMIDQLICSCIVIGWICEKNVIHQATYRKYIRSYIGCICKMFLWVLKFSTKVYS